MAIKVAINGFGRIGRCVTRVIAARDDVELVAVNDLANIETMLYLLQNDSVHGPLAVDAQIVDGTHMMIGKSRVRVTSFAEPSKIDFAACGADVVLECTGRFLTREDARVHLENGVGKVLFSAPAQDEGTPHFVMGVNEHLYAGERILSNASCTTNCLAPIAKCLDDAFGIEKGLMTTIHSYTNDQNLLDVKHSKDMRRARAAAVNMIPTTTGAAKAIGLVMPHLQGKLNGYAMRVPTTDVSVVDLTVNLKKATTKEEVIAAFEAAAAGEYAGRVEIDHDKRVSSDFVGSSYSCTFVPDMLSVIDGTVVKVLAWYDNEWGYTERLMDMAKFVGEH